MYTPLRVVHVLKRQKKDKKKQKQINKKKEKNLYNVVS